MKQKQPRYMMVTNEGHEAGRYDHDPDTAANRAQRVVDAGLASGAWVECYDWDGAAYIPSVRRWWA
jgi:hypothetical protein